MPKQPAGISKLARIEALRDTLMRWGRLNKRTIDERVSARLGCSADELGRTLYRDLEELEGMGEIVSVHFSRDGVEIADYDPAVHRNTYCEWAPAGLDSAIKGVSRLKDNKVLLAASPRVARGLSVSDGKERMDSPRRIGLYFQAGGDSHCILLETDELPIRIVLARVSEGDVESEALASAEASLASKRVACLLVPVTSVSSLRGGHGHLTLGFETSGAAKLRDSGSKNGTSYVPLDEAQAGSLIREYATSGKMTATDMVSEFRTHLEFKPLPAGQEVIVRLPVLIRLSAGFEAILCASAG